jgi:starvation-inducible DNA-binding protein
MTSEPAAGEAIRAEVLDLLGALLADEQVLAAQTRTYHWNVVGPQFPYLHPFFGAQFRQLNRLIDAVAERVRQAGGVVGPPSAVLHQARLAERPVGQPAARDMVLHLLADHEALASQLGHGLADCGERLHDPATGHFLTRLLARHEYMARGLRALLEEPAG